MTFSPARLGCRIIDGLSEVASDYDVLLCDVWGVIHDGKRAFADANRALMRFRENGGTVVLLTNAPRPNQSVASQIAQLGVSRAAYDEIVTSGDATVALITARDSAPLYHIGPPRDFALYAEVEQQTGRAPILTDLDQAHFVVCTGLFDDQTEGPDDYAQIFAAMRSRDLDMICANPDVVVHVGEKLIFCGGALAERYEALGGTVLYAGKPHPPIYQVALKGRGGQAGQARSRWPACWPWATLCAPMLRARAARTSTAFSSPPGSTATRPSLARPDGSTPRRSIASCDLSEQSRPPRSRN